MLATTTVRRRGRSMGSTFEVLSPCRSTTRRPSGRRPPLPSISSTTQGLVPEESRSATTKKTPRATTTGRDTEKLVLDQKRSTSHGSCSAWSMASLLQRCPQTPSPTCIPVEEEDDDEDGSTPRSRASEVYYSQSSGGVFDRVRSASPGEVGIERTRAPVRLAPFPNRWLSSRSKKPMTKSIRGPSPVKLTTDFEEEERGNFRRRSTGHLRIDHSSEGSGYEDSEIESTIDEHPTPFVSPRSSQSRRDGFVYRLVRWKEAGILSLVNKLKKKVAEIDRWERKETAKAKMEMKELEVKLERKREKAMERMQRRIIKAHRAAEKKRKAEKASMNKKMEKVADTFDKIERTGKLPWKVVFP